MDKCTDAKDVVALWSTRGSAPWPSLQCPPTTTSAADDTKGPLPSVDEVSEAEEKAIVDALLAANRSCEDAQDAIAAALKHFGFEDADSDAEDEEPEDA